MFAALLKIRIMKKKMVLLLWVSIVTSVLLTSCSPKIIGATPHRRDRNCGCENRRPTNLDSLHLIQQTCYFTKQP